MPAKLLLCRCRAPNFEESARVVLIVRRTRFSETCILYLVTVRSASGAYCGTGSEVCAVRNACVSPRGSCYSLGEPRVIVHIIVRYDRPSP